MKFGIDISRWQGMYDFENAKKEGINLQSSDAEEQTIRTSACTMILRTEETMLNVRDLA